MTKLFDTNYFKSATFLQELDQNSYRKAADFVSCGKKQITIGVSVDKDANGSPRGSPNGSVSSVLFCCDELTFGA